jgi:hypothetical protein
MRFRVLMFALLFIATVLPLPMHGNDSECAIAPHNELASGVTSRIHFTRETSVYLYANPGVRFRQVAALQNGMLPHVNADPVCVDGLHWWKVRSADGLIGWISDSEKINFQLQPDIGLLNASQHTPAGPSPTFR